MRAFRAVLHHPVFSRQSGYFGLFNRRAANDLYCLIPLRFVSPTSACFIPSKRPAVRWPF